MLSTSPLAFLKGWLLAAPAVPLASGAPPCGARRGSKGEEVETLLTTGRTLLGQAIIYPAGPPARVTADIITVAPGAETGWHAHDVPLIAYILKGELTVDYGPEGTHYYREGDVIVEAIGTPHNGRNTGRDPVRMFAVFLSAEGMADTVHVKAPQ